MSTTQQGFLYQTMVNGKQALCFYPTQAPGSYPVEFKEQWKLDYPTLSKEVVWKSPNEVPPPPPTAKNAYDSAVVLHTPGSSGQAQMIAPVSITGQAPGGLGYYNNCTYNIHNTYNYVGPEPVQEAATQAEPEAEGEGEGIHITEDEVKMDSMLHEQAQAIRQLHHLHSVDYGSGDIYGRRYVRGPN